MREPYLSHVTRHLSAGPTAGRHLHFKRTWCGVNSNDVRFYGNVLFAQINNHTPKNWILKRKRQEKLQNKALEWQIGSFGWEWVSNRSSVGGKQQPGVIGPLKFHIWLLMGQMLRGGIPEIDGKWECLGEAGEENSSGVKWRFLKIKHLSLKTRKWCF